MYWKFTRKLLRQQAIKQDLSLAHNPFHFQILVLLKTAIDKEWNKMPEEFILKYANRFDGMSIEQVEKMVAILSKFTVLCVSSYFVVYIFGT